MRLFDEALEAWIEWQRYKGESKPNGGGMDDQPWEWKAGLDAVLGAEEKAQREEEDADARDRQNE